MVCVLAELVGGELLQALLHRFDVRAHCNAGAICHAENVRVHCDRGFAKGHIEHDVGCLASDTGQVLQCLAIARHLAAMSLQQKARQLRDKPELVTAALDDGARQCRKMATQVMDEVRTKVGMLPYSK